MLIKRIVGVPVVLMAIGLVAAACNGGAESSTPPPNTSPTGGATVAVATNPTLGNILVDSRGMTLYVFGADTVGTSNCTGACLPNWPPLTAATDKPVAGPGVTGALGVIKRPDGINQVARDGMPLYTFAFDKQPGDTNGQGLNEFGGIWTAAAAAGGASPSATTTPTPTPAPPFSY
jgi:predicted lipoprotein with Yx(FWY)xxD motif